MKKFTLILLVVIMGLKSEANSPYITKVYDFFPAPGQFVNEIPEYLDGETKEEMLAKVEEQLCGNDDDGPNPGMISLGSYGGYVIFGFDHPVVNVAGMYDFKIYGNAFKANEASDGGSCEPGIVMVSSDVNNNGFPDDEWYELAGSAYNDSETIHNYTITYSRPDADRALNADPDPEYTFINDRTYIKWSDNNGDIGYVMRNTFHGQSYWPEWIDDSTISFSGTLLADNAYDKSGTGTYFVQKFFDWGYVDNLPNESDPGFNIEWAVDSDGNPVSLQTIDFIKVYCALNQYCGWIGETSTEVCGGEDLHPDAVSEILSIDTDANAPIEYFNLQGVKVENPSMGVFIKRQGTMVSKVFVK